jgi:hypothetical protein
MKPAQCWTRSTGRRAGCGVAAWESSPLSIMRSMGWPTACPLMRKRVVSYGPWPRLCLTPEFRRPSELPNHGAYCSGCRSRRSPQARCAARRGFISSVPGSPAHTRQNSECKQSQEQACGQDIRLSRSVVPRHDRHLVGSHRGLEYMIIFMVHSSGRMGTQSPDPTRRSR